MRTTDAFLMTIALFAIPGLAWVYGRMAGRRNWRLAVVILGTVVIATTVETALVLALGALSVPVAGARLAGPEFAAFLPVLGVFVAMLGWSSVPARQRLSGSQDHDERIP